MIQRLMRCAYPACTQVYHWAQAAGAGLSTVIETPTYEDVEGTMSMACDSAKDVPDWCDRTGFGLIKLTYAQRIRHPLPPAAVTFCGFDSMYCGWIKQREPCFKWHVHGPILKHNH